MRRAWALLIALLLAMGAAAAETAALPADTAEPTPTATPMPPEEVRMAMDALFAAVTGTDVESERLARRELTEEEILLRNEERALYRAQTMAWLTEVIRPEEALAEEAAAEMLIEETPSSSPTPTPAPTPAPVPAASDAPSDGPSPEPTEIVWTAEDGYQALAENEWGQAYLELMRAMGAEGMDACMALTKEICAQWLAEIDHEKLKEMNEDYQCWIFAPGTQIDYPVVQCEDNSYYLKRMFNREKNSAGTLFIDYRNLTDFQDPNTLIYGHHMRNDSMFGTLTDYLDQAYFEAHPYMLIISDEEIAVLELFAGYTTSDKDHCYDIAISDEGDMRAFLNEAMRKTNFLSGVQAEPFDRLVTLSTCAYAFEDARYIVLGRLKSVWKSEAADGSSAG